MSAASKFRRDKWGCSLL